MPRTARASAANLCYHVLNRGNNRASVFHKDGDFDAFVDLLAEAKLRNPIRILAYCVLPNHFHLALWPLGDGDLGRWMHWFHGPRPPLPTALSLHRPRLAGAIQSLSDPRRRTPSGGSAVHRAEPVRAGLVARAEDWSWSSLGAICRPPASRCSIPVRYRAGRVGWKPSQ